MKKGLVGPYQVGMLSGVSEALRIAEKVTKQRGADLEGIFYATAFQAGVDEFMVPALEGKTSHVSEFLAARTRYISRDTTERHWALVRGALAAHLPFGWERNEEFSTIWSIESFLVELLDAMDAGASVLAPLGIPDFATAEAQLPSELAIPLSNLFASITDVQAPSPIPQKAVSTEDIRRLQEIMVGDIFSAYVAAQYSLEDSTAPIESVLPQVASTGRQMFLNSPRVLELRKSGIGILQVTPKLVDAVFGKLPGALADAAAKLGIGLLEARRRVVIYDFRESIESVLISNITRMLKAAETGKNIDG